MRQQKHRRCPTRVDESIDAVLQGSMELTSISQKGSTGVYFNPLAAVDSQCRLALDIGIKVCPELWCRFIAET